MEGPIFCICSHSDRAHAANGCTATIVQAKQLPCWCRLDAERVRAGGDYFDRLLQRLELARMILGDRVQG